MRKALCLLLVFAACSDLPKNIIAPPQMRLVVYDMLQADEFINNFVMKDSTIDIKKRRSVLYERVFKLHGITKKDFYTSYTYYQQHPYLQKGLYDSLNAMANHNVHLDNERQLKPLKITKPHRPDP